MSTSGSLGARGPPCASESGRRVRRHHRWSIASFDQAAVPSWREDLFTQDACDGHRRYMRVTDRARISLHAEWMQPGRELLAQLDVYTSADASALDWSGRGAASEWGQGLIPFRIALLGVRAVSTPQLRPTPTNFARSATRSPRSISSSGTTCRVPMSRV